MRTLLIALVLLVGCASPPATPQPAATPTFDVHCRACKQCGGGLLDENGQEQGLCEEGFRLWQQDMRRAMGK